MRTCDPIEVLLLHENGDSELVVLGPNIVGGELVQLLIPANTFHTARVTGKRRWFLGGSTGWPGVVPSEDIEMGNIEELAAKLSGAAKDSFTKKCVKDAQGNSRPGSRDCFEARA